MDLKQYIRDVPDFPQKGILFRDITRLLANPEAFSNVIELLANETMKLNVEAIVAIESRGFIFAAPIARQLQLPLVPVRKPGKLPGQTKSIKYSLEYGTNQLDIHLDAIRPKQKVVIIDDLLATGGTAKATADLIHELGGEVLGLLFVIELLALEGAKTLEPFYTKSLVNY